MNQERWHKIEILYHAALELPHDERVTYLAESCRGDDELCEEVIALLLEAERPDGFLSTPTVTLGLSLLARETPTIEAGVQLGLYRIIRQIGRGGMGEVYLADDLRLERRVALKVLPALLTDAEEDVLRFRQETRAASAISHPNVAHVYEAGSAEGRHYIAMEYVDGVTLRQMMQGGPLDPLQAAGIALQITRALAAAHAAGVVHRDVKPENIMVHADGYVKVLDFGLAKLYESRAESSIRTPQSGSSLDTTPGLIMGTTAYMSPEQVRGQEVDVRTDVWSLGIILYEMLNGRRPFDGDTLSDVTAAILLREPAPCTVSLPDGAEGPSLGDVLKKTLQKLKEERYESAQALVDDMKVITIDLELSQHISGRSWAGRHSNYQLPTRKDSPFFEEVQDSFLVSTRRLWAGQSRPAKLSLATLAIALTTFVASSSLYRLTTGYRAAPTPQIQTSAGGDDTHTIASIAILPLENRVDDVQMDYFAKGVVDDLISDLGRSGGVRVIALSSARRIKSERLGYDQIKQRLGVTTLLSGTVERRGTQVVIMTQLVNLDSGETLWHDAYAADPRNPLKLRDALTVLLLTNIQNFVGGEKRLYIHEYSTASNEAYEAYLEGKYSRTRAGSEGLKRSISLLEKAVVLDPKYVLAYVELAGEYNLLGTFMGQSPQFYQPKAMETIQKAIDLDDSSAEAHATLAKIKMDYERDWPGCEREFRRAIELNPSYALAHHWYGEVYLTAMRRLDEAVNELNTALAMDPLSVGTLTGLAWAYMGKGDYEKALELIDKARALDPQDWSVYSYRAQELLKLGRFDEAIADARKTLELEDDTDNLALLGAIYGHAGRSDEAREVLDRFRKDARYRSASRYDLAIVHAGLGERDEAFRLLNDEVSTPSVGLLSIQVDPLLDSLRDDPRFPALVNRYNFPPVP
jgi:serine/threonine protein kinase/tetratricopeptide (TPR) repeat protein